MDIMAEENQAIFEANVHELLRLPIQKLPHHARAPSLPGW